MLLSTYVRELRALLSQHGDLEVEKWMPAKGRHEAPVPKVAYRRVFESSRGSIEVVPQFYHPDDNPVQCGDPVIRV